MKIWLYGYFHRIRSTRKLEVACREQLSLLWLTGLIQPDHNSLWRFWRDNKQALRGVFKRSAELAVEAGLVGLVLQGVDGTKIQAVASGRSGWNKKTLEKLLKALDRELEQTEAQIEAEAQSRSGNHYPLPESLADKEALRENVRQGLQQMKEINREHLHPKEPQARRMSCDGKNRFGYNAQAVVDGQEGVVVVAAVVNEENDAGLIVPMAEQAQKNCGGIAAATVADIGYGSGADIEAAAAKGINLLAQPKGDEQAEERPYHAHNFDYQPERGCVVCPQGKELYFARFIKQKGKRVQIYRCDHKQCPVRSRCTGDRRSRKFVEIWSHTLAVQDMRRKIKTTEGAAQLSKRGQMIERIFGQAKQHDGLRRWTVRELEGNGR